jgi:hypothetical protein
VRILLAVAALFCVGMFVFGIVAPDRSRRVQRGLSGGMQRGEEKASASAGRPGDWAAKAVELSRRAFDRSTEAGRKVRRKLAGD